MTHVSIVILHYNTPKDTHACLTSLREINTSKLAVSIIIVDNASREAFALTKTEQESNITVVRSESNLGFSGGNNLGIQYAIEQFNSEYVCLLNSDTIVDPDFLTKLVRFLEQHPKVGAVCPIVYFARGSEFHAKSYTTQEKGTVIWFGGGRVDRHNLHAFHAFVDEVDRGQVHNSDAEDFLTGCCMLIRREVLEKVSGFDDRYFLYLEDVELSSRIEAAGYRLGLAADAKIWHANAGSSGGAGSKLQQYYQTRNRLLYFWSYGSWRQKLTVARWAVERLLFGSSTEQKAISHGLIQNYGKETSI